MNFKKFAEKKNDKKNIQQNCDTDALKKTFDDTLKRSQNMSEQEIINEILKEADKERKNGNLKPGDLDNFYKTIAPMLDDKQIEKLKQIMDMIK